ncbi:hypothetical protein KKD37_04790, partial [Patescibacteria group bacterium]|nr:hypothetical protein [Patescibacteria group bacterium]
KPGSSEYVTKEAIHPQCFAKLGYNKVFTGHYHNMQSLNKKGDQTTVERGFVHYLGSPLHQDRSNAEATPVIWLLRKDGTISFKENKISPRFVKARWGALQRIGNAAGALIRNNYVDVYLGDERPGSEEIKKFMDRFQPAAYEVFIEEKEKESAPIIKGVRANPSNAIKQYVASQRQSKRFTRAGLRFLGRVKE